MTAVPFAGVTVPVRSEASPSHSLVRGFRPLVVAGVWIAFALFQAVSVLVVSPAEDRSGALLILYAAIGAAWAALTLVVGTRILPNRNESSLVRSLVLHGLGILLCGVVDTIVRRAAQAMLGGTLVIPWYGTLLYFADRTVVSYLAIVLLTRTLEAHDRFVTRQRAALSLRAQLARARVASLEEQLHPHFLFNCLGAVSELAHEAPAAAARMLRQLSSVLRFAIERGSSEVTVAEEMAALEPYLEVQRTRFSDWMTIQTRVEPEAAELLVPPLVLQPLVENAIKHGLIRRDLPGAILVSAGVRDGRLVLEVRDNGVGLRGGGLGGRGIGTSNVRDRLAAMYGADGELSLFEDAAGGVISRVSILAHHTADVAETATRSSTEPEGRLSLAFRRWPAGFIVLAWAGWGLLWTQQSVAYLAFRGRLAGRSFFEIAAQDFLLSMAWAALTPLMLLAARVVPITGRRMPLRIAAHAIFAVIVASVHGFASRILLSATGQPISSETIAAASWGILAYGVVLGASNYGRIRAWLRERDVADERIRADIAEAELEATYLRAKPRELLDRLEQIARAIQAGGTGADRDLALLGDQLRRTLDQRARA